MPHRDREARNAYSREYKRRMRADPVRKELERSKERDLYARTKERTLEGRRAKNSRYRDAHRVELAAKQRGRYSRMDSASVVKRRKLANARRNARRKSDPSFRAAQLKRLRAWQLAHPLSAAESIQRRIAHGLRVRLNQAVRGGTKGASAVRSLGCDVDELMKRLESQFRDGMTWSNYGQWHIDHIRPLISFDLTDPEQARAASHFSNLQPLWASENLAKSSKWRDTAYPQALEAIQT